MSENAQREKAKGGGTGKLVVTGLFMLPVVAVLLPSCIVLVVNMVPTIVAYVVDRSHEKYLAITVGLLNICGALPSLVECNAWSRSTTPIRTGPSAAAGPWATMAPSPTRANASRNVTATSLSQAERDCHWDGRLAIGLEPQS